MERQDPNEQPDVVAPAEEGPITPPPDEVPAPPEQPTPDVPPPTGDPVPPDEPGTPPSD